MFVNCKFQKCCPKYNNNPPSQVTKSVVENCTLESVTLDKECLSVNNTSTGYKVQDNGVKNPKPQKWGNQETFCLCYCVPPTGCDKDGVSVAPKESGALEAKKVPNDCCR